MPGIAAAALRVEHISRVVGKVPGEAVRIRMSSHLDRFHDWASLARTAQYRADDMARLCSVSQRQMQRYFERRFDQSPHAWLNELRLREAEELLLKGNYVKAVAFDLGFKDAAHFCRTFKLHYGLSPLAFVARRNASS